MVANRTTACLQIRCDFVPVALKNKTDWKLSYSQQGSWYKSTSAHTHTHMLSTKPPDPVANAHCLWVILRPPPCLLSAVHHVAVRSGRSQTRVLLTPPGASYQQSHFLLTLFLSFGAANRHRRLLPCHSSGWVRMEVDGRGSAEEREQNTII